MSRAIFFNVIAIIVFLVGVAFFFQYIEPSESSPSVAQREDQLSAANLPVNVSTSSSATVNANATTGTSTPTTTLEHLSSSTATPTKSAVAKITSNIAKKTASTTLQDQGTQIERIKSPYATPPESFDQLNVDVRSALVNILCEPSGGSSLNPISGSGVIIDPKGIILTNAHVAQYVLLSESPQINLKCFIRTGSPASAQWTAAVLYIPPVWVAGHVNEIVKQHPTGTGEHDYALLYITGSTDGGPLPASFPYLPVDTRPAIGFPGDQVLVASYPAELVGGIAAQYDLYAASSVTTIKQLLTFVSSTPDLLSLGGIIEAQGGSSGGAVVNEWGRLIALIATTSSGSTTADRDLRAIALSYINTDIKQQSGSDLSTILQGDPAGEVQSFSTAIAPNLIELYVKQLGGNN
ncbi:MAG: trypsin-like peptidase domain-containing protein [Candidatus Pacebacteria bacterium]|nr:trypsin-like peptidase domain-containing protein [Candidatus Paceibacterota bacterium]